jgi:hypothetical protein
VDALVSCGFKWLCGPYGTGFCWLAPDLLASLTFRPAYWLGHLGQDDLGQEAAYRLRDGLGAAAYDVFGTANFLTFRPWTASVEYLLGLGIDRVATGWSVPARAPGAPPWSCSATTGPSVPRSCTGAWTRPGSTWPSGAGGCGCPRTCTTPRPTSTAPSRCSTVTPPR